MNRRESAALDRYLTQAPPDEDDPEPCIDCGSLFILEGTCLECQNKELTEQLEEMGRMFDAASREASAGRKLRGEVNDAYFNAGWVRVRAALDAYDEVVFARAGGSDAD